MPKTSPKTSSPLLPKNFLNPTSPDLSKFKTLKIFPICLTKSSPFMSLNLPRVKYRKDLLSPRYLGFLKRLLLPPDFLYFGIVLIDERRYRQANAEIIGGIKAHTQILAHPIDRKAEVELSR